MALLRPGRFDRQIYVPLPDAPTRLAILNTMRARMPFAEDICLDTLAESTGGYSGAEVVALCQEAATQALSESVDCSTISQCDFAKALEIVVPRTPPEMIEFFERYRNNG